MGIVRSSIIFVKPVPSGLPSLGYLFMTDKVRGTLVISRILQDFIRGTEHRVGQFLKGKIKLLCFIFEEKCCKKGGGKDKKDYLI